MANSNGVEFERYEAKAELQQDLDAEERMVMELEATEHEKWKVEEQDDSWLLKAEIF